MGGSHRAALLVIGILGSIACSEGAGAGNVTQGGGSAGGAGLPFMPMAGSSAPTGGTMAMPMAGTMAMPMAGTMAMPMAGTMAMPMAGAGGAGMAGSAGGAGMAGMAGGGGAGSGGSGGSAGGSSDNGCLDGITGFAAEGPFEYQAMHAGSVKIWVPMVPAGCKIPVVHLANGTGASCSSYQNVLNRLASHGFLTTCYENANTGAGTQGVMAIDTVFQMFPDLADHKIGSTGHSQGGQAAFTVLQQAEAKWGDTYIYAGLAMEPASGFGSQPAGGWQPMYAKIKSPMFMFSGTADTLVSAGWVAQAMSALDDAIEAYNWSAVGATHIPTPQAPTMEVSIPWFRWKLLGDNAACVAFKALPMGGDWRVTKEQNAVPCN